jgi:hypothetical protein
MSSNALPSVIDRSNPDYWQRALPGVGIEQPARGVGDWYTPTCSPCLDDYVRVFGLDSVDERVIRFGIDHVECPAGWYGPTPDRAPTTMTEMARRVGITEKPLRARLAKLKSRGLIDYDFRPGHGGWVHVLHYAALVDLPESVRKARLKIRLTRRRTETIHRENVARRDVHRASDGSETIGAETVGIEDVERADEIGIEITFDAYDADDDGMPPLDVIDLPSIEDGIG